MTNNSSDISDHRRQIARTLREAFGGAARVTRYWDDNHRSSVDILSAGDRPWDGTTAYGTIGLSEHSTGYEQPSGRPIRVELVGVGKSNQSEWGNVLSTCAFNVINSRLPCHPGAIYQDVVSMYLPDAKALHVLLAPAFLWPDGLGTLELPDMVVDWLLVVPISEAERLYAAREGTDALQALLEQRDVEFVDLGRASVL